MNDLRNLLDESPLVERKSFITVFVKEIVVTDDHVLLKYTIPLSKDSFAEESIDVPHIVCFAGVSLNYKENGQFVINCFSETGISFSCLPSVPGSF